MSIVTEQFASTLWLLFAGRDFLVGKSIELLRQIESHGSLSKAVHAVPISYKSAWDLLDKLNNASEKPLVETSTGGRFGGGTVLTEYGRSILKLYDSLERKYRTIFDSVTEDRKETEVLLNFIQGLCMKTSARNQMTGVVSKITKGTINSEIAVKIADNTFIKAIITNDSVDELAIEINSSVVVLVKASSVILFESESPLKCSIQNVLRGKVVEVRLGLVNGEVLVELPGGKIITAVITRESTESLDIKEGAGIVAAFSASNVIIALPV
jgi:molybdate transport system regulatory protein